MLSALTADYFSVNLCESLCLCGKAVNRTTTEDSAHDLPDLGFAFPTLPVLFVQLHETLGPLDPFFFCFHLVNGIAADDLLGFCERSVDDPQAAAGNPHSCTPRRWQQSADL